jgi:prepilin-type N-terminal cleavage/methylation domain-containing protein
MRRGYTLIELMIVVALIGIIAAAAGVMGARTQSVGVLEVQHERARLLLDYHGLQLARGAAADPEVAGRLEERLPGRTVSTRDQGLVSTITVEWTDPFGRPVSRAVTVFRGSPR